MSFLNRIKRAFGDLVDNTDPLNPIISLDNIPEVNTTLSCDDLTLVKSDNSIILNDIYFGWSEPEGVQWADVPAWDNRDWNVFFPNLDTDGIGSTTTSPSTTSFSTFKELIDELNNQLSNYGSSFRLIGHQDGNRILVTDLLFNQLLIGDPYLTTYNFQNMELVIEDSITTSDYLVKGRNPKDLSLSNIAFNGGEGYSFKKNKCICDMLNDIPSGTYESTDSIIAIGEDVVVLRQGWIYDGINTGNGFMQVPFVAGNIVSVNSLIVDGIDYLVSGSFSNSYTTFQEFLDVVNPLISSSGIQLTTTSNNDFYVIGSDNNPLGQVIQFDFHDKTAGGWFTKQLPPDTVSLLVPGECKKVQLLTGSQSWNLTGNANTDPSIDFIGTTDIQDLVIKTNNTEAIRVDANGNVGIGTSTPTDKLHVYLNQPTGVSILLQNDDITASGYASYGAQNGDILAGLGAYKAGSYAYEGTSSNHDFRIQTNNATRINVDKNGNVAIGNFAPTTKFHTSGSLRFEGLGITGANTRFLSVDSTGVVSIKNQNQIKYDIRTVTVNTTLSTTDCTVIFNGSNLTATLPTPAAGTIYNIKNINPSNLSVTGNIDGTIQTITLNQFQSRTFHSDAATWYLI